MFVIFFLGLEDLKNPSFHREVCFLGHRASHNTMVNTSGNNFYRYFTYKVHDNKINYCHTLFLVSSHK